MTGCGGTDAVAGRLFGRHIIRRATRFRLADTNFGKMRRMSILVILMHATGPFIWAVFRARKEKHATSEQSSASDA